MADREKEGQSDPKSNYANKIKEKIKEIDQKINTKITIPQYSKHTKQKAAAIPYYYYRENKEHYMSVFEHLTKKYDVNPYIYKELEMNEGYNPGCRHIFPYSGGCAQCSHYPVYANPRDPFKPNPPILNIRSNQNHLRRWIEFTELDDNLVLMEELQDEWNAYKNCYYPIVSHQQVMHKYDARKLVYLMQYEDFVYDDFVGRTPNFVQSNFTYDRPIIENVDNSFARILQQRKEAVEKKNKEQEENENAKAQTDLENKMQNDQTANFQTVQQLQESLQQQSLANQKLQDEIKFLKSQGYQPRQKGEHFNQVSFQEDLYQNQANGNGAAVNEKQYQEGQENNNTSFNQNMQQGYYATFSNKQINNQAKIAGQHQGQGNNKSGSENQISINNLEKSQTKIRQPPSQTDIQKMYNPKFAVKPSSQEFNLKTFDNKSQYSEEVLQQGESSQNIKLKTFNQANQDQNILQSVYRQPHEQQKQQKSTQSFQKTTFTHFAASQSQLGGQSKKFLPSSAIKLKTRIQLPTNDEYYGHNVSPTHVHEEQEYFEPQINSLQNFDQAEDKQNQYLNTKEDREKFIQSHNSRVSSIAQLSRQLDSHDHDLSQLSIGQAQKQKSNKFSDQKIGVQLYQQIIQDVQEEATPQNQIY
ncbi:hypothetical protein TTHERM_00125270 (macronuclear) [Tetrahymena thermophila SB210]|uniref:Uncharacterized protein n=1 Tax=Tetrahymena thermophila (strain SB210) TaxID=312017 RepID=I7M7T5_TETTS|nr:hypothetical protein TTHERM_00125270 [Tetrahymena thermophila SB210]EAR95961.1 hypothetical protein TTHERM_00125270 [Tetrahymena thermophila SB210]|eukprot:XP_001016206.1 hypothetical protein TTHERM_00125270 [Tetrahymena thermophila SB210]